MRKYQTCNTWLVDFILLFLILLRHLLFKNHFCLLWQKWKCQQISNCNYVKTFWHLIWKTDLQTCKLWTAQIASHKSVNNFWLNLPHPKWQKDFTFVIGFFCNFNFSHENEMASDQERNMKMKKNIIISQCGMQQRVCNFYQKKIAAALTVHINVLLVLEFQSRNYSLICKFGRKSSVVNEQKLTNSNLDKI